VKLIRPFVSLLALIAAPCVLASTIHVPKDQPTIQAGINAANDGDIVLVSPGTYTENINFNGKAIKVKSAKGPKVTVIDGGKLASVVTFASSETRSSVLHGFTVQNGVASLEGGGVSISSSPSVTGNIIQNNGGCNGGGGIGIAFASPLVQGNTIVNNSQMGCSGGIGGGGISVRGAGSAEIIGNLIAKNIWPGNGGGIALFAAGTPTIMNNIFMDNSSSNGQGGGIWIVNDSDAMIVQNLFFENTASQGGGIYFLVPSGSVGPTLVNNTIVGGSGANQGSAVFAGGFDNQVQFFNNLLIGLSGQNAVDCDGTYSQQPPTFTNNDAYSPQGTGLQGTCASQSNQNGNISANPKFVNPSKQNYQLRAGSPAINAGTNSAPDLPKKDLAGHPRIVGGTIDMGAYEYQGTQDDRR
jgi:hypothetical protein